MPDVSVSPPLHRQRFGFWQLVSIGIGALPSPETLAARAQLTGREQRRARRLARRGEAMWDAGSAWYVLAMRGNGPEDRPNRLLRNARLIALGFVVVAAVVVSLDVAHHHWVAAALIALCGGYFAQLGIRAGAWRAAVRRSAALSEPLVIGSIPPPVVPLSERTKWLGIAAAVAFYAFWMTAVYSVMSTGESLRGRAEEGIAVGVLLVPWLRFTSRWRGTKSGATTPS